MSKATKTTKLLRCALEEYLREVGGHIMVLGREAEIVLPVVIEEVPGGVQFNLKGRIVGDYIEIYECTVSYESETHHVEPVDLETWALYVNEKFSKICESCRS